MAKYVYTDYGQASNAAFMGDFGNREHILPGGAKIVAADFTGFTDNIIPAGTLVGRTAAERAAGTDFSPAADADDEIYIVAADVDKDLTTDVDLVRHGSLIKTNFLPSYAAASVAIKAKLEAKYQLVLG